MNVKQKIKREGVRQWQVADEIGITEFTFSRWLRRPENLKPDVVAKIEAAIQKVKAQKGAR